MFDVSRFASVKCPAQIIRDQFNRCVQHYGSRNQGGTGTGIAYRATTTRAYSNVLEYNPNTTYIIKPATNYSPTNNVHIYDGNSSPQYVPPTQTYLAPSANMSRLYGDSTDITDIVGYLTYQTVSEYCAVHNYTNATQLFNDGSQTPRQTSYYDPLTYITDTDGNAINDISRFGDWIVPTIQWFYGDKSNRQSTNVLQFMYYFTATDVLVKEYLNTGYITKTISYGNPAYIAFSPPYMSTPSDNDITAYGSFASGYVNAIWGDGALSPDIYVYGNNTGYYKMLYGNPAKITTANNLIDVTAVDNVGYSGLGLKTVISPVINVGNMFIAYPDTDTLIRLFADYGITVSTDIDDAYNPKPTEQGTVNPDPTDIEIPHYPDNTTEQTPIDPAYITPSTFGKSMVYNPATTKNFLKWVSDNTVNIDNWARLFANPVDVIQGINIYNLDIVAHDTARTQYSDITDILGVSTNIPNYSILDGYNNIISGGELTLQAYYGNYADYTSMTYQAFLPFVGYISLRAADVVNCRLQLFYAVDFATGTAIAFLNSNGKLIYSAPCTVCGKIPISISDKNSQIINNTLSGIGALGGLLGGIASGNVAGGIGALMGGLGNLQLQTNYSTKGSMSGNNIYKLLPAFIERTRYDLFLPSGEQQYLGSKYQAWAGAPSTQFAALANTADANGYVESDYVVLPSCTATEQERNEIRALIQKGVYIN